MHRNPGAQGELFGAGLPEGLLYVPDFLGEAEEASLIAAIQALPLAEARYRQYTARRRIASFGSPYDFGENELRPAAPLPDFLKPLRVKLSQWLSLPAEAFSDALVAEYRPGTPLGWHRDVPEFAVITGISLGVSCRMRFRPYPPGKGRARNAFELCLEPRSAYVMRDEARWRWQHAIPPTRGLRYSITFRTRGTRRSAA